MLNKIRSKLIALFFWQLPTGDFLNQYYNILLFYKYSFSQKKLKTKSNYEAFLTKQYHIVEKGMALHKPRFGFGKAKISTLISKTKNYIDLYGSNKLVDNIRSALAEYLISNEGLEKKDTNFYNTILEFINEKKHIADGGTKNIKLIDIEKSINFNYNEFIKTRTSVRDFSDEDINFQEIRNAIENARHTPSVCNRQAWKVYSVKENIIKSKLLKLQAGNSGFSDSINTLLLITTDLNKFTKMEGNQPYIDGGLFSMNLVLSLHHAKIASCCLNTCVPYVIENEMKNLVGIPKNERLIMMIALGKYKNEFKVATSFKRSVEDILEFI